MERKIDLRIQKTYISLHNAFTDLLEEKRFENITVNELCEKAMRRRTTFYKHFGDKYEYFNFYLSELRETFKTQVSDRAVQVTGSEWHDDPVSYKVKLEGARLVGYRCLFLTTARDPNFIANLDWIFSYTRNRIDNKFSPLGLVMGKDYHVIFRVIGRNAAMGPMEPLYRETSHEVGIAMEVVAPTQELAHEIAYFGKYGMVWCNYPGRTTISGNVAYMYSPSILNIEPAYELSVHHLLPIPADQSLFPIRVVEVGKA